MSYPNVPLGTSDWQRRIAQAVNYLLNSVQWNPLVWMGQPDAGQRLFITRSPVPISLADIWGWVPADKVATADAVVMFKIGGTVAATVTYPAGQQDAVVSITSPDIPANTDFEIIAPDPQDATLADFTLTFAISS